MSSVLLTQCCSTSHPKSQWLQSTTVIYFACEFAPGRAQWGQLLPALAVLAGVGQRICFQDDSHGSQAGANCWLGAQPGPWARGLRSFPGVFTGCLGFLMSWCLGSEWELQEKQETALSSMSWSCKLQGTTAESSEDQQIQDERMQTLPLGGTSVKVTS